MEKRIFSLEDLIFSFKNEEFSLEELGIEPLYYDENKKTLALAIPSPLKEEILQNKTELKLYSDLKFLILNLINFYSKNPSLSLPKNPPTLLSLTELERHLQTLKDFQNPPNEEQLLAYKQIFTQELCYIWGVAGSGKTKVVLLHSLATYLKKGKRVALLAPTNTALEQSLITLLQSLKELGVSTDCILRLGMPSLYFSQNYKQNCDPLIEDRKNYKKLLKDSLLIAATLDTFLKREELMELEFSHFFIDEAGFSPLIKTLPLCSFNKPLTLLGDHKQLTPILALQNKDLTNPKWNLSKIFGYSSLFLKDFFNLKDKILNLSYIHFSSFSIQTHKLSFTYRYGDNLAKILDYFVYKNGLRGFEENTQIFHVQSSFKKDEKLPNANINEANTICTLAQNFIMTKKDFAILTPFVNQRKLILSKMPSLRASECVFTIHSSQGQEFDSILLSPVALNYYLSDSRNPLALYTLNVALSRAKKEIILVCDKFYWQSFPNQFLGALLKIAKPYKLY